MMIRDPIEVNRIIDQLLSRTTSLEQADIVLAESQPRDPKNRTMYYDETAGKIVVVGPGYKHTFTKD